MFCLQRTDDRTFEIYHAVYAADNLFLHYDWNQLLDNFTPHGNGYLLLKDDIPIGGAAIRKGKITAPFLIAPYDNPAELMKQLLQLVQDAYARIELEYIPEALETVLRESGAYKIRSKCQMIRPTAVCQSEVPDGFYFDTVKLSEKKELVDVIFQAHQSGYTSFVEGPLDPGRVEEVLQQRLDIFASNHTLNMGVVVKECETNRIVGVCIAGKYPDVPNDFSTIHQVAVHPSFQRRGIAAAMIRQVLNIAHICSPVILLGVLHGNPAETLYQKLGFRRGPVYSDYQFERKRRQDR